MKTAFIISTVIFLAAVFSLVLWAFAGLSLWMPVADNERGREAILVMLHAAAILQFPVVAIEFMINRKHKVKA